MASILHISLPDPLKAFVDAQVDSGDFATPSDFVGGLVQQEQLRRCSLENRLLAAVQDDRGSLHVPDDIWENGDIVGYVEDQAHTLG